MKAKKLPGCCPASITLQAAVDDDDGDRHAAQRLGQRARARADHRQLVGGALEAGDRRALARAHERLEREGLDDPDALHRLLQRFQDGGEAVELVEHHLLHPPAQLADADDDARRDDQRQRRHQRVLRDHHPGEADQGQHVARQRGDEQVERAARRLRDEGLAGDELGRMAHVVEGEAHRQHLVEDAALHVGDDIVGDARQHHRLAIGGEALERVDRHDRAADDPDRRELLADEDLVDHVAHDPRRHRGRRRDHDRHAGGEGVALPVLGALVAQQPRDEAHIGRTEEAAQPGQEADLWRFRHLSRTLVVGAARSPAAVFARRPREPDRVETTGPTHPG